MSELMERAVPPYTGTGDWGAVLRDAGAARRRARLRPALAFAVVAAALVVAWQAGSPSRRSTARWPPPATAASCISSSRARCRSSSWTSTPARARSCAARTRCGSTRPPGARERETFAGVLQWESLNTTGHGREIYSSLATGYRDALRSGSAKVVGETESVYWIRISPGHDVAVSRENYRPVSMRVGDMPETRILTYETLREMPSAVAPVLPPAPRYGRRRISLAEAKRVLGRRAAVARAGPSGGAQPRRRRRRAQRAASS